MPILPDDAVLRSLPIGVHVEQRVWLESVGRCVDILDIHYTRLTRLLQHLGTSHQSPGPLDVSTALADAWGALDAAHRFNLLLQKMPNSFNPPKEPGGVREPRFRDLAESFKRSYGNQLELLRHGVQHLDQRQAALQRAEQPVWGHLTWIVAVDPMRGIFNVCTTIAGGPPEVTLGMLNPGGRGLRAHVDLIELHAHGNIAPLSSCYHETADLAGKMERSLASWKHLPRHAEGVVIMVIETTGDASPEAGDAAQPGAPEPAPAKG
jgi:hypothetical protein